MKAVSVMVYFVNFSNSKLPKTTLITDFIICHGQQWEALASGRFCSI